MKTRLQSIARSYIYRLQNKALKIFSFSRPNYYRWQSRKSGLSYVILRPQSNNQTLDPGAWFDEAYYKQQRPHLSNLNRDRLLLHYRSTGWKEGLWPHPLFNPSFYLKSCISNNWVLEADPLTDWLSRGLEANLSPSPLFDLSWLKEQMKARACNGTISLKNVHPWGAAAEAIATEQLTPLLAPKILRHWIKKKKLRSDEFKSLKRLPLEMFQIPAQANIGKVTATVCVGYPSNSWQAHALLQYLPFHAKPESLVFADQLDKALRKYGRENICVLHTQSIQTTIENNLLPKLAGLTVFDPIPDNVDFLIKLGVNAHRIHYRRHESRSSYLVNKPGKPEGQAANIASDLGLPNPASMASLSTASSPAVVCLGSAGPLWEHQLDDSCWCLPAFHNLKTCTSAQAHQLAVWLQECQLNGLQLVELRPPTNPLPLDGFEALAQPKPAPPHWLPVQRFYAEITPSELQSEMTWRRMGCPPPSDCTTPSPSYRTVWEHRSQTPKAAVCVSLYNYALRIETALDSVHAQNLEALELVIVDDASTDGGSDVVQAWLERHSRRFARTLLLQHEVNGGLAASRNTAFGASEAPWCFVLDADNELLPNAVAQCLAVADGTPASTAVVHPLVGLKYEHPDPYARALLSPQSWQRESLRSGNYVDAMALVRRSAWQAAGGYTHIPGGWEDFDFWCTLIDAGFNGVLCPQLLAVYTVHQTSMAATTTRRLERPLSRLLQHRHPWLDLPLAAEARTAILALKA